MFEDPIFLSPGNPHLLADIFQEARRVGAFSGGVIYLAQGEKILAHDAFGDTAYDAPISRPVTKETIYDFASISKLFTLSAVLLAARENTISLEEPVSRFFPEFYTADKNTITIRQLLNHSSGIEIAVQALIHQPTESWIHSIADAPLHAAPGTRVLYSCTNYFLLARLVEMWTEQTLDEFLNQRFFAPLNFLRTGFSPLRHFAPDEIAPMEIMEENDGPFIGIVHDEAAREWEAEQGSACGNAGLFGTAEELARFARLWLQEGAWENRQILHPHDVRTALTDAIRCETYNQAIGWHCDVSSFMSPQAPVGAAGHAGFTGPTMFIVPSTNHICIILNNRVYPTRSGPNRFPFHRRIAAWMLNQS